MIPKGKLLALLLVFGAVGTLAATGAFTTVEAERTADVDVAGDANALLAITPAEDPENSSFIQQSNTDNEAFEIVLEGNDGNADGLNTNSTTTAQNIFNITNNGEEDVDVWINTEGGAQEENDNVNTTFYIDDSQVDSQLNTDTGQSATLIGDRITEFNALVDDTDDQTTADLVISESRAPDSVGESPLDTGTAVNINPGQTVTVSMAIEIESDASVDLSSNNDPILNETTILAVNDEESSTTIAEGTTTSGTEGNENT